MQSKVVAVIPAYCEARAIQASVKDALAFVHEVVVVDDCSSDKTSEIAKKSGAYVLRHAVNRGQGAALLTGTRYALHELQADIVVHFDGDGQMQGSEIPDLIAPILSGDSDVALGSRFLGRDATNISFVRKWLTIKPAILFTVVLSGMKLTDAHNGFRALSRSAAETISISLDRMAHASEIIDQIKVHKLRYTEVPVTILYTDESLANGQSFWSGFTVLLDIAKHRFFH